MRSLVSAIRVERAGSVLQDRAAVIEAGAEMILAVADGAGGRAHGDRAADLVIQGIEAFARRGGALQDGRTWTTLLATIDETIARDPEPGETTAVVVAVAPGSLCGASVGDSEAWLITPRGDVALTSRQRRKPFLGTGAAVPVSFREPVSGGVLVVGSDGLFKYASLASIRDIARRGTPEEACAALIDLVRLPSGTLQDDVAVIVCHLPGPA